LEPPMDDTISTQTLQT